MADDVAVIPADTDTTTVTDDTAVNTTTDTTIDTTTVTDDTAVNTTDSDKVDEGDATSPESYSDFKLPDGVELDSLALEKAAPIFKELGLTQEQAQKLVDFQAEMVQEGARSQEETLNQLIDGWQEESKNDKEFGGEKFEENVAIARLPVERFGTPEFKQLLEDHGVGSHPEMIRYNLAIGKLLKEDVPGGLTAAASQKKDRIATMYPNS